MAYIFNTIARSASAAGVTSASQNEARSWFRDAASKVDASPSRMISTADPFTTFETLSANSIGKMYLFKYDAKHKDTLPFWDAYPLVFIVDIQRDGLLSLNLHYLPPNLRARLMDQLYGIAVSYDGDRKKLAMTYDLLKGAARFSYFKPCIKKHLFSQIRSKFMMVPHSKWDMAMMLNIERFQKASSEEVWKESAKQVTRGNR
jgi:hypothetical protein